MIDQVTIERIQDAARIVDVVSDFITLRKRGANYVGLCPFHDDHTPSFYVSPAKNICKCFACGEGGAPVHFIMKHEQLSYYEALKYLAKKYHIEFEEKELTDEEKQEQSIRESLFILNEYARDFFVKTLHEHPEGKAVGMSYFRERGFRDDIIKKFQLGYSLEQRDAFSAEALRAGHQREYLLKTGLAVGGENMLSLTDRFRGRVIFPVHTLSGKVVAFGGRILKKAENTGKYINSPESEIYSKSNELYGIYFAKNAIVKQDRCYLVEGYTDVISMHQAGIENVVASLGTALTHGQIRLIRRFSNNITVLYDGDTAGINAALRGIDLLLEEGMNVKVVLLPDGEDPDSFARKQNAESFTRYIDEHEVDFIRFKTRLLLEEAVDDPIKRAGLIANLVQSISVIPNTITRSVYVHDCANLLDVDEKMLVREVNKIRLKNFEKQKKRSSDKKEDLPVDPHDAFRSIFSEDPYEKYERQIIRYIIRYGMKPIYRRFEKEKRREGKKAIEVDVLVEEGPLVIHFVKYDLERDHIEFTHPLYRQVFEEAVEKSVEADFVPDKYFLYHPDSKISELASEVMTDKYHLSKIHAKLLGESMNDKDSCLIEENSLETLVPRATTELKNAYILQKIEKVKKAMQTADSNQMITLLQELQQLQNIKKELAKILGERIILKY
ncbi:MAG: DNA primase [Bacteroidales bacterium]|jgi:DNA primase|nr:DNA primase [Bacteroidales bacterium]